MGKLINQRIRDLKTGQIGLVTKETKTPWGEEMIEYVTIDESGKPKVTLQTVANVVVLVASIWETIFPLIQQAVTFFLGAPGTWKAKREAKKAIRDAKK